MCFHGNPAMTSETHSTGTYRRARAKEWERKIKAKRGKLWKGERKGEVKILREKNLVFGRAARADRISTPLPSILGASFKKTRAIRGKAHRHSSKTAGPRRKSARVALQNSVSLYTKFFTCRGDKTAQFPANLVIVPVGSDCGALERSHTVLTLYLLSLSKFK